MTVSIHIFTHLSDNYCVLLHDNATGATATIDAIDAAPIKAAAAHKGWTLTDIFITHHHWDHTDGLMDLKSEFSLRVTGPKVEAKKIRGLDQLVGDGDTIVLGETKLQIIATPGHTLGHIAFYDQENQNLFCGDALFCLGCGRMFEGTPGPMWRGLKSLRDLPDQTSVYCGHEYSVTNAEFALSIDPNNKDLQKRAKQIKELRKQGKFTVPFNLGEDKRANPFLRADDTSLAAAFEVEKNGGATTFAAIRTAKDKF